MTVYELIQKLAAMPADAEVAVCRASSKRPMRVLSVIRRRTSSDRGASKPCHDREVEMFCDWLESE